MPSLSFVEYKNVFLLILQTKHFTHCNCRYKKTPRNTFIKSFSGLWSINMSKRHGWSNRWRYASGTITTIITSVICADPHITFCKSGAASRELISVVTN